MDETCQETIDPRIRRTRLLLQQALEELLQKKDFDRISVQDIAEAATVNRATFYDHYADKFALLECMVAKQFGDLLEARGVRFGEDCVQAVHDLVLGVCDYLAGMPRVEDESQMQTQPHLEAAVIQVVRRMILAGMENYPPANEVTAPILAATLSWAVFGAAKEWARTPARCTSEVMAGQVLGMLGPIVGVAYSSLEHRQR